MIGRTRAAGGTPLGGLAVGRLLPAAALIALTAVVCLPAIDSPGAALRDGQALGGRAYVVEPPRAGPFGASATVELADGSARGTRLLARLPREFDAEGLAPGAELRLVGAVRRPDGGSGGENAGRSSAGRAAAGDRGFDLAAHLRRRGIAGELIVDRARPTGGRRGGLAGAIDRLRERALAAVAAGLPAERGALAQGMVLGADEDVPETVRADFRDAGLAHVLAASGQNVMLLVALAIPLLALAGLSHAARIPLLIGLVALYVPLAGAGPSIQRAGVMGIAGLLAMLLARPAARWHALLAAACATLMLNPRVWQEPGWQLSFAAVAGILLLGPGIRRALDGLPRALAEGIALTTAATVATAPLIAHHFGEVSLASLPANVAALPLVAPIMWLGMLRALLGQLAAASPHVGGPALPPAAGPALPPAAGPAPPPAGDPGAPPAAGASDPAGLAGDALGRLLEPLLAGFARLAALFADLPGGVVALRLSGAGELLAAYAAIGATVLLARRLARGLDTRAATAAARMRRLPRGRRLALAVAAAALAALALAHSLAPSGPPATLTVTFLDVGQGDATLVQHPDGTAVLFDGGPPEGGVARLLRRAGVRRLSALVMTHASRDHHGGLGEVVERFPVGLVLDGGDGTRDRDFRAVVAAAQARGARRVVATAPLALRAGALRIDVLGPPPRPPGPPPEDPNPRAVVAVVSSDGFDLLLSGDAESESLLPLALPDVDAMKLPHHGSADSGLPELLDRLMPELASIPVGENSYGHPARSTLAALRAAGVPTYRNDRHGTVRVEVEHGELSVATGP